MYSLYHITILETRGIPTAANVILFSQPIKSGLIASKLLKKKNKQKTRRVIKEVKTKKKQAENIKVIK